GVMAAQVATARVLFGMARDGKLPRFLAHVHARSQVPDAAILAVAALNLLVGLAFANRLELLISLVSFGALTGFLLLHVAVIVHFVWRQGSRLWLRHLVVPLLGFASVGSVLLHMSTLAKLAGIAWLGLGVLALLALRFVVAKGDSVLPGRLERAG